MRFVSPKFIRFGQNYTLFPDREYPYETTANPDLIRVWIPYKEKGKPESLRCDWKEFNQSHFIYKVNFGV